MMVEKLYSGKIRMCCAFLMLMLFASGPLLAGVSREKITLKVTNEKLVKVLEEIKKQSGYNFIYNEKYVKDLGGITVDVNDVSLDSVMKQVLKGTDLRYRIQDRIILLEKISKSTGHLKFKIVKGNVKDERGEPLPGVTVMVKGSVVGTSTDVGGNFTMNVSEDSDVLLVSFVGMETVEVNLAGRKEVFVVMKAKVDQLDEVVVTTGYTQITKRRATGSVAVIGKDAFTNQVHPTVDQLLQGLVAGVNVIAVSGRPGQSAKIRIRGTNTLTGDAEPLWVVDGVPLQRNIPRIATSRIKAGDFDDIFMNGIAGINPNDIENVTILKDASASAIYGSRAAGGVIVITTKSGKSGNISVNYAANVSMVMKPQRDGDMMNSKEKLAWEQELWDEFSADGYAQGEYYPVVGIVGMLRAGKLGQHGKIWTNAGFVSMNSEEQDAYVEELSKTSTNWFDQLFRNSFSMNHYLSLSGGSEKATYYLSFGYSKNNGILKKTSYDRYNLNAKMNLKPIERLSVDFGFDLAQQASDGSSLNVDPFSYAFFANPYEKPYNEDGSYCPDFTYFILEQINGGRQDILPSVGYNIMREINETSNDVDDFTTNLRLSLDYKISSKFSLSSLLSYSFTNNKTDNINGIDTYAAFLDRMPFEEWNSTRTYGSITQTSANNSTYMVRGQANFSDIYAGIHRISMVAGAEIRGSKGKSIYEKRYGYDPVTGNSSMPLPVKDPKTDKIDYSTIVSFATAVDGLSGQSIDETRFASFYAFLDYSLYDKYVVNTSFRTDGSNNFGSKEQFNPTWSIGAAWHIGDEGFMIALRPVLSRLKLSMALGYTGNISKTTKPDLIMKYENYYRKTDLVNFRIGRIGNSPNPHLKWEKTKDMKVALDFGLFDNRIGGVFEAYYRMSTDVVSSVEVPMTTGFSRQGYNTSEIENKGVEFTLQARVLKYRDFSFNASVNVAWNRNVLKSYDVPTTYYGSNVIGYPLGSIFTGKPLGINPKNGIYTYKLRPDADVLTARDMTISENYLFYRGTSTAPVTGGFSFTFSYKTFSLNVGGAYSLNRKILNELKYQASYKSVDKSSMEGVPTSQNDLYVNHLNVRKDAVNRWTADRKTGVKYPRIIDCYASPLDLDKIYPVGSDVTNASMLEDGSFLRVRNVSLSYNLPGKWLKETVITSLGVSCMVSNLFTITDYSGIDPETPGATYPLARSFSFGINVGF